MLESKSAPTLRPTVAYSAGRKVTLAPHACPYCGNQVRAVDADLHDDGDVRLICSTCHRDLFVIER